MMCCPNGRTLVALWLVSYPAIWALQLGWWARGLAAGLSSVHSSRSVVGSPCSVLLEECCLFSLLFTFSKLEGHHGIVASPCCLPSMLFSAGVRGAILLLLHPLAWAVELLQFSSCILRFSLGFRVAVLLLFCLFLTLRHSEDSPERERRSKDKGICALQCTNWAAVKKLTAKLFALVHLLYPGTVPTGPGSDSTGKSEGHWSRVLTDLELDRG
eukprot:85254-Rhodomonas_salina.1